MNHSLFLRCLLLTGNRFTLAFTGTAVGTGTLAADRQALTVTEAAVAGDIQQALDAHLNFGTQLAFHFELIVDHIPDGIQFIIVPLMHFLAVVDACLVQDVTGRGMSDPIDIGQSNFTPFIFR